jgi:hypothetical protein
MPTGWPWPGCTGELPFDATALKRRACAQRRRAAAHQPAVPAARCWAPMRAACLRPPQCAARWTSPARCRAARCPAHERSASPSRWQSASARPGPLSSTVSVTASVAARSLHCHTMHRRGCSGWRCPPGCAAARPAAHCRAPGRGRGRLPARALLPAASACGASSGQHGPGHAARSTGHRRGGAALQPRQGQQLLHQVGGTVAALQRGQQGMVARIRIAFAQGHLGLGADGGDGGAQLVRGIGREAALGGHQGARCARTARSEPPAPAPARGGVRAAAPVTGPGAAPRQLAAQFTQRGAARRTDHQVRPIGQRQQQRQQAATQQATGCRCAGLLLGHHHQQVGAPAPGSTTNTRTLALGSAAAATHAPVPAAGLAIHRVKASCTVWKPSLQPGLQRHHRRDRVPGPSAAPAGPHGTPGRPPAVA